MISLGGKNNITPSSALVAPTHLSYNKAVELAWQRGLLQYKLRPHQKDLYKLISGVHKKKTPVSSINCARRYGKTTVALLYAIEFGIKNPRSLIRFVTTTAKDLRTIVRPIMQTLLEDCPEHLKPKFNGQDSVYIFPNGSMLYLHGCDGQQWNGMRGNATNLAIIDEAAFCDNLKQGFTSVILPQFDTCNGRGILISTPDPMNSASGEEFKEFCAECELNGSYFKRTIHDNSSFTLKQIEEICKRQGGPMAISWLCEYLCEWMIDAEKRLVPEWNELFVQETPKDDLYNMWHRYVGMDLGVKRDFTVMLFGYYNFKTAQLIIQDEVVTKNKTTGELAALLKDKELKHFPNQAYRRISDNNNPQLILDFQSIHKVPIISTSKTGLEVMVNEMRMFVGDGRLIVEPRCKFLTSNLEYGVWSNSQMGKEHRDFGRTNAHGHFDAIAAIMYLIRNLDTVTNPIPAYHGVNRHDTFITPEQKPTQQAVLNMFRPHKRK